MMKRMPKSDYNHGSKNIKILTFGPKMHLKNLIKEMNSKLDALRLKSASSSIK